jgi:cell division transport system ATP-binding protein
MLFFCYLKKCIFNIEGMRSEYQDRASSATRRSLVSLRRVSRFYGTARSALFDVSLDILAGEFVYITGPSGAGKSTLLRVLGALEMPDTGRVLFNGHDLASLKRSAISLLRRSMGIVFQDFRLVPELTVQANIALPLEVMGTARDDITRRTDEVLERVGLEGRQRELAGELSGGEQQRIAIARAIVSRPELILADEPTGNLDAYNGDFVLDLLEQSCAGGATVVLATHDRMLMAARPHRILALKDGRLMGMSPSSDERGHVRPDSRLRSIG